MTANEAISSWEKIQQGVKEAETLMGKREYNLSMVKARQTLEFMVHCLCDQAGIMEPDLSRSIDALYNERVIKTTCEHYHKIRMLGNSAVHENNTSAYDANQAYQFLSQEVYTFSHDYRAGKRRPSAASTCPRIRKPPPDSICCGSTWFPCTTARCCRRRRRFIPSLKTIPIPCSPNPARSRASSC